MLTDFFSLADSSKNMQWIQERDKITETVSSSSSKYRLFVSNVLFYLVPVEQGLVRFNRKEDVFDISWFKDARQPLVASDLKIAIPRLWGHERCEVFDAGHIDALPSEIAKKCSGSYQKIYINKGRLGSTEQITKKRLQHLPTVKYNVTGNTCPTVRISEYGKSQGPAILTNSESNVTLNKMACTVEKENTVVVSSGGGSAGA